MSAVNEYKKKTMNIGIEAQRIFRSNKHGMDFVALESIRELQKIDHENEYFIFVSPGDDRCLEPTKNFHIIEVKCPTYPLWEQFALPQAAERCRLDLLHCTSNTAPIFCPVPLVLTLHDIIFLEKRAAKNDSLYQEFGWHYRRHVVPRILDKCKKIITVSNFERDRINERLHIDDGRLLAIYNGYNPRFCVKEGLQEVAKKYIPSDGYLFFLGNTDPKKNTPNVLKAYSEYLKRSAVRRDLLVADLREECIDAILKEMGIEDIKPHIWCPGYISNSDLLAVYNNAFAFLYPSLRESFGIPIIEAMACGTPVITSNTSAMPEIAGAAANLVDPKKPEEIAAALLKLEKDRDWYGKQVEYGLDRAKLFSWRHTAENLLKVYNGFARN
jgi:glycosyltransferase involved in cell wall biosynthesis